MRTYIKNIIVTILAKFGFTNTVTYRWRTFHRTNDLTSQGGITTEFYRSSECAEMIGVTETTLLSWHRKGIFPKTIGRLDEPGSGFAFDKHEVDTFIITHYGLQDETISIDEVVEAFDFGTRVKLRGNVKRGKFPQPDYRGYHGLTLRWKNTTLDKHRKSLTVRAKYVSECISTLEAAKIFGISRVTFQAWYRDKCFNLEPVKQSGHGGQPLWHKPTLINICKEKIGYPTSDFYSQKEVIQLLGYSSNADILRKIETGIFIPPDYRGIYGVRPVWNKSKIHKFLKNHRTLIKRGEVMDILGYISLSRFLVDLEHGLIPEPVNSPLSYLQWDKAMIEEAKLNLPPDWNEDYVVHNGIEYITTKKALQVIGISETTFYKHIKKGRLPKTIIIGRINRKKSAISLTAVMDFVSIRNKSKKNAAGSPMELDAGKTY